MASLQTSLLAAFILLATVLPATEAGPYAANVEDSVCCQRYIRHALPWHVVDHYYSTSDSCRRPGVVLVTRKGWEICANPRLSWVKKVLQLLDR
ncbi:C-C motif chemokine 22 [Saccopteryx bilineata]|uniref:C-C motif chemokine 22 n=1 Tax=Saccopteryx bilineata TaxID=59482 RepID=UPI003390132F